MATELASTSTPGALTPGSPGEGVDALVGAIQRLSLARTFGEVQEIVRTTARSICHADGATFVLRDGDRCFYLDEDAISPLWKGQRFPLETCISGWAMLNRTPAAIRDIYADDRIPHEAYRPTFVKSLVMVPIRRIEPIGAIGNYWAQEHQPTDTEIELLSALADSTAVAMENVRVWGELEDHVADRTARLQAALELNERVLGTLAHEIRNALAVSVGMLEVALGKNGDSLDPAVREQLEYSHRAAADGVRILNDQLAAARDRAGELQVRPSEFDPGEVVTELVAMYRAMRTDGRVELVAEVEDELPALRTDRHLLVQLLRNLVSNALKFTVRGEVRVRAARSGDAIALSVSDTGVGITPQDQTRIFEEWAQVEGTGDGNPDGAGLGLAFVMRIARLLGGELALESEIGRGSTFTFTIPI